MALEDSINVAEEIGGRGGRGGGGGGSELVGVPGDRADGDARGQGAGEVSLVVH